MGTADTQVNTILEDLLFSILATFIPIILFVIIASPLLSAAEVSTEGKPALPGESCQTAPIESWTQQEKWVWKQVCERKIADFNKAEGYGGKLDPKKGEEWPETRVLRPAFLETILLHEPYRSALPRQGVRIVGAWFTESLDLSFAILVQQLWLDYSRFESPVDLAYLQSPQLVSL